jgi:hypothetical protein
MRIVHWFRALHIRSRYVEQLAAWAQECEERVHRLEIAARQLREKLDDVETSTFATRQKLNAARAGRPRKDENGVTQLHSIPTGDKAALRAYFKANPPRADNKQVE